MNVFRVPRPGRTARAVRLTSLAAAAALLVLGSPSTAFAQCAEPNYRGSGAFPGPGCPAHAAGVASGVVWAVLAVVAGLWLVHALSRSRAGTTADLAVMDAVFSDRDATGTQGAGAPPAGSPVAGGFGGVPDGAPPPPRTPPSAGVK
ncbi:hypothetical protein ACFXG6_25205 [Streptomyces roseus]|uniref:hypothetical protein n=1 Tax=Streptomyces roseus TaxID=66430 RepID=UPI003685AD84